MKIIQNFFTVLFIVFLAAACSDPKPAGPTPVDAADLERDLQTRLINAKPGDVIEIPAGAFKLKRQISLTGVSGITLKGAGKGKTILSFKEQVEGAEGIIVKADDFTLEGLTIQDTKGDALKIQEGKNIVVRDVETTWTDGAKESNGGYGLYPVSCTNVLLENCEASYASDAGIYVGQSTNVVVRNCLAHHNVAGIEIENCIVADVYDNVARENTGGLLIFDMPNLPQANGNAIRVHDNLVEDNNFENFAPDGGMVAVMPPGSGVLVMGHRGVEIFNNKIINYKTIGVGLVSYQFTGKKFKKKEGNDYSPYCSQISIYDNEMHTNKLIPDISKDLGKLVGLGFKGPADIVIDGWWDPNMIDENGMLMGEDRICIRNNGEELVFACLFAGKAKDEMDILNTLDRDVSKFDCTLTPLEVGAASEWIVKK